MNEPTISFKDLKYRYRGQKKRALDGISLDIAEGEFLMVMGQTEAGKSSLLMCLNGLIPHFHKGRLDGEISILGRNTLKYSVAQMADTVGIVFQDFEAQLFSTNVELEVAFGPENLCIEPVEIIDRIDKSLKIVKLDDLRRRPPSTLSGGQKQKLAIASVLALNPRVLVMDEPTSDLDPISSMGIFDVVNQLRNRDDITLIVAEHQTEEALFADRILVLKEGRIARLDRAENILRDVAGLESMGIMPLGVPKYFTQMGDREAPLTPEEGVQRFQANGWRISAEKHAELVAEDARRSQQYGDVFIQCTGLEHAYPNGFKALQGVDLAIHRGEMLAIIGQNGSGKTTLVKHFNGLLFPTAGQIEVNGHTTKEQGVFKLGQEVGYVFQNPDHQIFSEKVFDEVAFTLRLRKTFTEAEIKKNVTEALAAVGLSGYEEEDPFSLTKSGRQRVAVASVLAAHPPVLILDEPTTGLDYLEQCSMMNMVKQLNKTGSTIIFITHHMWVVTEYAHRVIVMKEGRVCLQGTTREVFSHEAELREACLLPPQGVTLSNRLGKTLLNTAELVYCTQKGDA